MDLALRLVDYLTLGKLLNHQEPQFPQPSIRANDTHLARDAQGLTVS